MRSTLGTAAARLRDHETHAEIVKKKLRDVARFFEELSAMSHGNAEDATLGALGQDAVLRREGN